MTELEQEIALNKNGWSTRLQAFCTCRSLMTFPLILLWSVSLSADPPLPALDGQQRAGVATCANSKCHDAERPWQTSKILQNEYRTWTEYSTHAESYNVLKSPLGKQIGTYLKIDPLVSAQCLDCHTDNVPAAQRSKSFRLEDGVGCEACHGGAAPWIENHVSMSGSRGDYLKAGLYPTEFPIPRAQLCLSCHLGTDTKFVDHRLLAAGHPRLVFELDTFFVNMPLHHRVDQDYAFRKAPPSNAGFWITGQIIAARRWLSLFGDNHRRLAGILLEPAFQDCYGCHSVVRPGKGSAQQRTALRLDIAHLRMLDVLFADRELKTAIAALEAALGQNLDALSTATRRLERLLAAPRFQPANPDAAATDAILQRMLTAAAGNTFRNYIEAEQATMAIASMLRTLDADGRLTAELEKLYDATNKPEAFSRTSFSQAAHALRIARNNASNRSSSSTSTRNQASASNSPSRNTQHD